MWALLIYITLATASILRTTPALFVSYKLIPGLTPSLPHSNQLPFTQNEAAVLLTRALEACNSEHYIFIKARGLSVDDFHKFSEWHFLREKMSTASTHLVMPHILDAKDTPINSDDIIPWEKLEETVLRDCNALKYVVDNMDAEGFPKIQHTNKILVEVKVPRQRIGEIDELIRGILKKLPTANVGILLAGTQSNEVDESIFNDEVIKITDLPDDPKILSPSLQEDSIKSKRYIFPDLTVFDKSRGYEYERNSIGERRPLSDLKDGEYAKDAEGFVDDTWLEKKVKKIHGGKFGEEEEFVSVFNNKEFVKENAVIIASTFVLIFGILFSEVIRGFFRILKPKQKSDAAAVAAAKKKKE